MSNKTKFYYDFLLKLITKNGHFHYLLTNAVDFPSGLESMIK